MAHAQLFARATTAALAAVCLVATPGWALAQGAQVTIADKTVVTVRVVTPALPALHDGDLVDLVVAEPVVVRDWIAVRGGAKGRGHLVASSLVLGYVMSDDGTKIRVKSVPVARTMLLEAPETGPSLIGYSDGSFRVNAHQRRWDGHDDGNFLPEAIG